jgi:AraC-like DNA-binding protein
LEHAHIQNFYSLILIEKAEGEIAIDGARIRADQAKAIVIKPRCISSFHLNREATGHLVCFTEDFFSLRYNTNTLRQFAFLQAEDQPFIRLRTNEKTHLEQIIQLMGLEYFDLQKRSTKVLRSYLNILLFELDRLHSPEGTSIQKGQKSEKFLQFEELIEKHFLQVRLPSQYADLLHVSANYLNKICKEESGQTAGDLIRKRIMVEAQRHLHFTNLTVKEIADQLGFESTSYFVTFFKKSTGITPEQFRKTEHG